MTLYHGMPTAWRWAFWVDSVRRLGASVWKVAACVLASAVLVALGGCYSYVPVRVCVRDAASTKPVAGARVETEYMGGLELTPMPRREVAATDAQGEAIVAVTGNPTTVARDMPTSVGVTAAGYRAAAIHLSAQQIEQFKERRAAGPATITVDLKPLSPQPGAVRRPTPR